MAQLSLLVIDDFLDDPDRRRAEALKQSFQNLNNTGSYTAYLGKPDDERRVAAALGRHLSAADERGNGRFNVRYRGLPQSLDIHADACSWGAILYLGPQNDKGGTNIYHHRSTKLTQWPTLAEAKARKLPQDFPSLWKRLVLKDGLERKKWNLHIHIPARYNRLLLIRGGLFHGQADFYGKDVKTGRLTQLFFFNELPERLAAAGGR